MSARPFRVKTMAHAATSSMDTLAPAQLDVPESTVRQVMYI